MIDRPLAILVGLLLVLAAWTLWPVMKPLVLGGFVVIVLWPLHRRLLARLGGRRRLATWLSTLAVVLALVAPIGICGWLAARQAVDAVAWIAKHLPRQRVPLSLDRIAHAAETALASVGRILAGTLLALLTMFYLFRDGDALVAFLHQLSPLEDRQTHAFIDEFRRVARGIFFGNVVTAAFHGVAGGIGYWIFGAPSVLLLAILTGLASFVPLIGTGIVWLPIVAGLWLTGHHGNAIGLLVYCVVVVGSVDNILRPLVSRGRMAIPDLLMFLTLFGGLQLFGLTGLVIGPLLGSLAVTALRLVARARSGTTVTP